ncbi:methyltransferase, TIGR04325 family [Pedobacter sp.]|uniref:methyltransferase, TIGR04325 family n=1 Tax=Pedobacter sp. TaxID=1411316 RepID=UPI003D7F242B
MFKALFSRRKKDQYGWFGDYSSWAAVSAKADGYQTDNIINRTRDSLLKVKSGTAVYERDSVVFDQKEYPYVLITFLIHSASLKKKPLNILDFGGSLGSTYYQVREFLTPEICASWNVVEQEHYVAVGKQDFEDQTLKFFPSIEACLTEKEIDFVLLSSSVQYLEEPHLFLQKLAKFNFDFLFFDRTAFNKAPYDRLTLQIVPPEIYEASYPAWFFNKERFLNHFSGYKRVAEFPSYVDGEQTFTIDGKPVAYSKGFYFINLSKYTC